MSIIVASCDIRSSVALGRSARTMSMSVRMSVRVPMFSGLLLLRIVMLSQCLEKVFL